MNYWFNTNIFHYSFHDKEIITKRLMIKENTTDRDTREQHQDTHVDIIADVYGQYVNSLTINTVHVPPTIQGLASEHLPLVVLYTHTRWQQKASILDSLQAPESSKMYTSILVENYI